MKNNKRNFLKRKYFFWFFLFYFLPIGLYGQKQDLLIEKPIRKKVGLALGGGGAKSYIHIGVLRALEKLGIRPDYISGTSAGSIIGSLYAAGYSANEIEEIVKKSDFLNLLFSSFSNNKLISIFDKKYGNKYFFKLPLERKFKIQFPNAFSNNQIVYDFFSTLLYRVKHIEDFSKLPIPFLCITTDLESGDEVILKKGDLVKSILASSSLPSLLSPVRFPNNKTYIDGGIISNIPIAQLKKEGMDYIIAVDISNEEKKTIEESKEEEPIFSLVEIMYKLVLYRSKENLKENVKLADVLIKPDLQGYSTLSFKEKEELIKKGEQETMKYFHTLKKIAHASHRSSYKEEEKITLLPNTIKLKAVEIEGLEKKEKPFFEELILKAKKINVFILNDIIKKIRATDKFYSIYYRIKPMNTSEYILLMEVEKSFYDGFLKFGLHHDYVFKTSLLVNYSLKNMFFNESILSFDLILGENFRGNLDYYFDKKWRSFGYHGSFMQYNFFHNHRFKKNNHNFLEKVQLKSYDVLQRIYTQVNVFDQYAIGLGAEHQFFHRKNQQKNPFESFTWMANTLGFYTYLYANNLDHLHFPTKGLLLNAELKKYFLMEQDMVVENKSKKIFWEKKWIDQIKGNIELNYPIVDFFSLRLKAFLGICMLNQPLLKTSPYYNTFPKIGYLMGGINKQQIFNFQPFYGYPFAELYGLNKIAFEGAFQIKFLKNHYLTLAYNIANLEDQLKNLKTFHFQHNGLLVSYGYDSIFGPMELFLNTSSRGETNWYISLGVSF